MGTINHFIKKIFYQHTVVLHMLDYSEQRLDYGMACVMAVVLFVLMVGSNKLFRKFINRIGR